MKRPTPRCFRGFTDRFSEDLLLRQRMIDTVRGVYESYGFLPLETPALEFVDVLGKFLPESTTPEGGIFALRNPELEPDADKDGADYWLALRYDLTAPLARVAAKYQEIPRPFRRYQVGNVWRYEKPGPGRFREFTQFDFDSVGVASVVADAEACMIICDTLQALGFAPEDFVVRVNDRKIMQGMLEVCGVADADIGNERSVGAEILRAIDKLDRLGIAGVKELLGAGRADKSGDFKQGVGLDAPQIDRFEEFLSVKVDTRAGTCERLMQLVGESAIGREGIEELVTIHEHLDALGYDDSMVVFDPTIVRGLSYYTGPVFEGILTKTIKDEKGRTRQFGSIFGGGRYDDLVERFTGQKMPATGASAGVDRMLEAFKLIETERSGCTAKVLVTAMDRKNHMLDYMRLAQEIRRAGVPVEVFLGSGNIGKQLKYADKRGIALAVIAGGDEFANGTIQVKDLALGRELAAGIESHEEWKTQRPAQQTIPQDQLIATIKEHLA